MDYDAIMSGLLVIPAPEPVYVHVELVSRPLSHFIYNIRLRNNAAFGRLIRMFLHHIP